MHAFLSEHNFLLGTPALLGHSRLDASFLHRQAAGVWAASTRGVEGSEDSFPCRRLALGRGERGSNLELIKCPSLMSFFN